MMRLSFSCAFAVLVATLSGCSSPDETEVDTADSQEALTQSSEVRSPVNRQVLKCAGVDVLRLEGTATLGRYAKGFEFEGRLVLDEAFARGALQGITASKRHAMVDGTHRGPLSLALDRAVKFVGYNLEQNEDFRVDGTSGSVLRVTVREDRATLTVGHYEPNGFYGLPFVADGDPVELSLCRIMAPLVPAQLR
jgi:hypothetical protein